jgi:hypothetical protein
MASAEGWLPALPVAVMGRLCGLVHARSLDEAFARVYRSPPLGNPDKLRRLLCSGKL